MKRGILKVSTIDRLKAIEAELNELGYSSNLLDLLRLEEVEDTIVLITKGEEEEYEDEYLVDNLEDVELFLSESLKAIKGGTTNLLKANTSNPELYVIK